MNFEKVLEWHSELDKDDDVGDGRGEHAGDGGPLECEQTQPFAVTQALEFLQWSSCAL